MAAESAVSLWSSTIRILISLQPGGRCEHEVLHMQRNNSEYAYSVADVPFSDDASIRLESNPPTLAPGIFSVAPSGALFVAFSC
jgi:hypothetical protein